MKAFGIEVGGGRALQPLVVGGTPSADLLPPEVRAARRSRSIRRGVVAAAVMVLVVAGAGAAAAKAQSLVAQVELAAGEARTIQLLQEQAAFSEVTAVQDEIGERAAARAVATSQEIIWQPVLAELRGMLPEGTVLVEAAVDGATPMLAYGQPVAPLQGPRLATVTLRTLGVDPAAAPAILDRLSEIDGFVDGHVPLRQGVEGAAETRFVLHLDGGALAGRFPAPEGAVSASAPTAGADQDGSAAEEGQQ